MPFKSKAQQRFLFSQEPELAEEWVKKYGNRKNLPEKINGGKSPYANIKEKKED